MFRPSRIHGITTIALIAAALTVGFVLAACSDRSLPTTTALLRPTPPASMDRRREESDPSGDGSRRQLFTPIDFPGAATTTPLDIADDGTIVGRIQKPLGSTHGFMRRPTGEFTIIDFPGASFSVATGLNHHGDVVGQYSLPGDPKDTRHGYVSRNGTFTTIDVPGSVFTNALGINDRGDVVGRFCTRAPCVGTVGSGNEQGYLLRQGVFEVISVPGARETDPFKFGRPDEMFGVYLGAEGNSHLFVLRGDDFTTVNVPGAKAFAFDNGGLNRRGDIVGTYCDAAPCVVAPTGTHGFLLHRGDLTRIDFPGANATGAFGINVHRNVVGFYFDATHRSRGFLMTGGETEEPELKR